MAKDVSGADNITAVIVNDDLAQLELLAALLDREGIISSPFTSAEKALESLERKKPPDLIITCLYMPGIDGWHFCRMLHSPQYAEFNKVPIMVVSATLAESEPGRIEGDLGVEAFLPTPVESSQFSAQVRNLLKGCIARIPKKFLFAEDDTGLSGKLKNYLESNGYLVDTAFTLLSALNQLSSNTYDMAVLDYHLPDGIALTLLEHCRKNQPNCICIVITGSTEGGIALNCLKQGAAAYVRKPFDPEYLVELFTLSRRERSLLRAQRLLEMRTLELKESESKFRSITEQLNDLIALTDENGIVTYSSPASEQLFGISAEEMKGCLFTDFLDTDSIEPAMAAFDRTLRNRQNTANLELVMKRKDGTTFIGEVNGISYVTDRGHGSLLTIKNITDRKLAEKEKEAAIEERKKIQDQLHHAVKMESVGRLAGGVAHDFNNMLGVILGHTELALEKVSPDNPVYNNLLETRKAASRSADLTRQLLAFARKQPLSPKILNLNSIIEGMIRMLERLIGDDINLVWKPGRDLWTVKADPSQIDQILANFCVNARDAISGFGKITIETENVFFDETYCREHPEFKPGEYVLTGISDNGAGIPKEIQEKVFEPFFTTKEMGKGTGLGLATSYGIIRQNNGYISIYSEPGMGTTFKIYLPRCCGTESQDTERKEDHSSKPAHRSETILLVEDEPAILEMAKSMLELSGYRVLAAPSPENALEIAGKHPYDINLLVTDVVMPGMNGRELKEKILQIHPGLKCLFMSGYTANVIAHHGVLNEGVNFIQKPFSVKTFASKVREILDGISLY